LIFVMKIFPVLAAFSSLLWAHDAALAPALLPPDPRYKANVLLVVAHPDDDTTIGAYLARLADEHKRVAVIFCTSGNGGGDMVGNEAGRSLGQIRILEARRALASLGIENVWFLGGDDTPGQDALWSLDRWGHGRLLDEMVRLVRLTRPEVILTWLPESVAGENHADHHAAGVLATEAFDLAGDRTKFTEQVSPARDRTGMMNYTEGLLAWQPQKIYYFTDAFDNFIPYWHDPKDLSPFRRNFLDGHGPSYPATDNYTKLAAQQLSFYQTQDAKLAEKAIEHNDYRDFKYPVRFLFGKSAVGGSVTGDIFENVRNEPISFQPVEGFRPDAATEVSIRLGDPWLFYQQFWQAHNLQNLAQLLPVPETSVKFGGVLHLPMVITNCTKSAQEITLLPALPAGWTDETRYTKFQLNAGESYPLQVQIRAPENGAREWQELSWKAEGVGGRSLETVKLRVYMGKGSALPQ